MRLIFVEGADSLAVDDENLCGITVGAGRAFQELGPEPETLGAGVDGGSNAEASFLCLNEDPVQEERLAGAIFACDCDYAKGDFCAREELVSFLSDLIGL